MKIAENMGFNCNCAKIFENVHTVAKLQKTLVLRTMQTNLILAVSASIRQVALELLVTTPMSHSQLALPVQLSECTLKFMLFFIQSCLVFNLSLLGVVQIFFLR